MMNIEKRHAHLMDVAQNVCEILSAEGLDGEFVASIRMQIERKAGSLLPPVNGVMSAELSDAVTKAR